MSSNNKEIARTRDVRDFSVSHLGDDTPDQKGPLCDTCAHRHVCRYKQEYKTVNEAIRDLVIGMPRDDGPETECVRLADIHWIEPIIPNCRNYQLDYTTIRDGRRTEK